MAGYFFVKIYKSMSLSKKDKKFIKKHYKTLKKEEIANELNVSIQEIEKYAKKHALVKNPQKQKRLPVATERVEIKSFKELVGFILKNKTLVTVLILLPLVVYANSLRGEFVSDDLPGYVNNPAAQNLSEAISKYELGDIIYAISYSLFGLTPIPLHVLSLILHIKVTLMFFIIFSILFHKRVAFYAALLFSVHPVTTETVDWISAKGYLLTALFVFMPVLFYLIYKDSNNRRYFAVSIIIYSIGAIMMKTPWILISPAFFILVDFFFRNTKVTIKNLNDHFLLWGFTALYAFVMFNQQYVQRLQTLETVHSFSPEQSAPYYARLPYSIFMTLYLYVFPNGMTIYHEGASISGKLFALMIIVTIIFLGSALWLLFSNKKVAALLIFILAATIPMLSPIQIGWLIAERYLYMGLIAFCIGVAMILLKIEEATGKKYISVYLLALLVTIYSVRTMIRNHDWSTRERLWWSTIRTSPGSHRAYNNLGDVYSEKNNYPLAAEMFAKSVELNPTYAEAWHNLGTAYLQMGDAKTAYEYILHSYELKPVLYQSTYKLGLIEYENKNYEKAREYFMKTVEIAPQFTPAYEALAAAEQQVVQLENE